MQSLQIGDFRSRIHQCCVWAWTKQLATDEFIKEFDIGLPNHRTLYGQSKAHVSAPKTQTSQRCFPQDIHRTWSFHLLYRTCSRRHIPQNEKVVPGNANCIFSNASHRTKNRRRF